MVGAELAPGVFGRSPAPSPDGKWVAVFFTAPYQTGGPMDPIHFKHFVSFFSTNDGRYVGSRAVTWTDRGIDPALTPHASGLPLRFQFLWNKNSKEVFVLSRSQAFRVPVERSTPVASVSQVPARAVPTVGGPVSPRGQFVFLEENHAAPNRRRLGLRQLSGWTAFEKIPLTNHKSIRYSVP